MELCGKDVIFGNGADECLVSVRACCDRPPEVFQVTLLVGIFVRMNVVVFRVRPQTVEGRVRGAGRIVPPNVRHRLHRVVESIKRPRNDLQARAIRILGRCREKGLQSDADAHERFPGIDVSAQGGKVARGGELGKAMAEVTYAREDKFLFAEEAMDVSQIGRAKSVQLPIPQHLRPPPATGPTQPRSQLSRWR